MTSVSADDRPIRLHPAIWKKRPLCARSGRSTNCHAQRKNMQEKRRLPYRWAAELRRIVGEPVQAESVDLEQHLAA
jgi:hypothetical protein